MTFVLSRYVPYLAFLLAVLLWLGVGYFAWAISATVEEHRVEIAAMERQSVEHSTSLQLHALARATKEGRATLERLTDADLLEILDAVEALAQDAGLSVQIGEAPAITEGDSPLLRTVSFTVDARGSFTQIARVVAFLESLPIPSALDELQFERLPSPEGNKASRSLWRVVAKVRFLTTADIPAL